MHACKMQQLKQKNSCLTMSYPHVNERECFSILSYQKEICSIYHTYQYNSTSCLSKSPLVKFTHQFNLASWCKMSSQSQHQYQVNYFSLLLTPAQGKLHYKQVNSYQML